MKLRIHFIRVLFLLPALVAFAEEPAAPVTTPLSIEAAIHEAKANSPEIKELGAKVEERSWKKLEGISGYLPHLSVNASHLLGAKYQRLKVVFGGGPIGFPSAIPQDSINLLDEITVFDGFQSWNAFQAAGHDTEAAEHELAYANFKIEHEVKLKFVQALAASALREVADENIKSLEEHLSLAKATERSGLGTRVNVLRLEAQLEEARAEKLLAEDNLVIARNDLLRVLGKDIDDGRPLQGELPEPKMDRSIAQLKMDVAIREDIKAQKSREAAFDSESSAAGSFWLPKVSLFAQQTFYKFGAFDPVILPNSSLQNAYSAGLNLHWDLFDGGASFARRQQAVARWKQSAERTHDAVLKVPGEFEHWKRRYTYNSTLYRARLRTIEKSEESVRLAKMGLKVGTSTNSEVLDAELDLFKARAGVVRAQADAAEALAHLELTLGKNVAVR